MKIIANSKLARFLSVDGIVLFPFIFIAYDENKYGEEMYDKLINHEKIHYQQQKEMLVIFFYLFYILNYLINLVVFFFDGKAAYRNIIFEKEAKINEGNLKYLKTRKFWDFRKFRVTRTL